VGTVVGPEAEAVTIKLVPRSSSSQLNDEIVVKLAQSQGRQCFGSQI
jgi:hypothetical protein